MSERERELLERESRIPTSTLARLGRTAWWALRGRRWLRGDPSDAELTELVAAIGQLKGVAMKVGQIMSYIDVELPAPLRAALAELQTASPAMPFARVRELLAAELGPRLDELAVDEAPVAAASIGQVHRARLRDGRQVALKVRYPEVARAIAGDFAPAALGSRFASLIFPGAKVDAFIAEARERLLRECDYAHEARMQRRFAALYAAHPTLAVPEVIDRYSTDGVLATAWADGLRLEAYLATSPAQGERDRIGAALFELYVGTLYRHALFNCDPHPGNYVFHDGRVTVLDYGCARAFERDFVRKLASLTRAVKDDRPEALHAALLDLGIVRADRKYDRDAARALLRGYYGPMLRDETAAISAGAAMSARELFASKRALLKLTLPGELLFLFRIRFGLMSILARLGSRANWYQLERRFADEA